MSLHKYVALTTFTLILSTPFVSLAANKLAIAKEDNTTFPERRLIVKKNPIVKTKKARSNQASCTLVHGQEWTGTNETISVGLKGLTAWSKLNFGSFGSSLQYLQTCKFTVNSGKVRYIYAIPDNSGLTSVTITAYLDGEKSSSITVSKGEVDALDVNTSGFKSIAIEITASNSPNSFSDFYLYAVTEGA
jgi:hypothetical protein